MEKLIGDLVLVNPNLINDPANRQGEVGIITQFDLQKDEFYVGFGNQPLGLYSSDALLVLKAGPELHKDLLVKYKELEKEDYKTIWSAHLHQAMGTMNDLSKAFEFVRTNDITLKFGTMSLQDKLNRSIDQQKHTNIETSINR